MKLIEKSLTVNESLEVFDIQSVPNKQELKSLYKKLALQYHPDKNDEDQEMMYLRNDAYNVLSNTPEGTTIQSTYSSYRPHIKTNKEILEECTQDIDAKSIYQHLFKYFTKLDYVERQKQGNDYIDYIIEVFNKEMSLFIEYNFEINNNKQVYFMITVTFVIGKIKEVLFTEMFKYPEGKNIINDYTTLFPKKKMWKYIYFN
jgi:DnaJ-class molecular chaperone